MKTPKAKPIVKVSIIVIVFALLAAVISAQYSSISFLTDQVMYEKRARIWDTKLLYACHNYKIYPCDEEGVSTWNKQNPDKAITEAYLLDPGM